jgi:P-type conjugative transfer protein TrbJ
MRLCSLGSVSTALLLLAGVLADPAPARAQWVVSDPANLAQNLAQVRQMIQQVITAKRQLEVQIAALKSLAHPNWRHLALLHRDLADVVREGEALGYSLARLEHEFDHTFPGYTVPADPRTMNLEQMRRTLATLRGVLRASGMQARDAAEGQATLERIQDRMAGISGTQQALELQATIQGLQAGELGALRQQVAAQTNADAVYRAYELQQRMQQEAAWDSLVAATRARPVVRGTWDLRVGRPR